MSYTSSEQWTGAPTIGFTGRGVAVLFSYLVDEINRLSVQAKSRILMIRSKKSAMSIADMFDLQMAMNKLSQFSEMSTSVIGAMQTSIISMARNVKG